MKILHVETGKNIYGGALQVLYLIKGLRERGIYSILVCTAGSKIFSEAKAFADKIYAIPMRGDVDILFIWRLMRIIKKENPDIVHLHSRRGADVLGGIASKLSGLKTILTRRVDNPESPFIVTHKYRLYDKVIVISEGIKKILKQEGIPLEKIECVHSAVDIEKYSISCDKGWIIKEFDLPSSSKLIGVIAQLIKRKGHIYLIKAIPEVLNFFPEARFIFFGKGYLEDELRRLCKIMEIENYVIFAGFRDDIGRILSCLDLLVHPAEMEGLGVSLLQASASGAPIVAADVGGIPEIVKDGINGFLVPPKNPGEIAKAIIKVLSNPALAKEMGRAGRRIVEKEFSIDKMVNGNLLVYKEILKKR